MKKKNDEIKIGEILFHENFIPIVHIYYQNIKIFIVKIVIKNLTIQIQASKR
jgi:hypothetical protein